MQLIAALTPDIVMMVGGMVLMLVSAWGPESAERQHRVGTAAIGVCIVSALCVVYFMMVHATAGRGVIAVDNFRWIVDLVLLGAAAGTIGLGLDYNAREKILPAESHVLVLLSTSGMMILASARDLTIVFLGIELMSIAVYILTGMNRRSEKSAEGAIKYFLLGAFSTGFLLYGIALVYGATGTTSLALIGERVAASQIMSVPMLLIGIGLMLVGFGFKVALAPFHMWAPDVYEGAPTPITAFMAAAVKAASFAAFMRVFLEAFGSEIAHWHIATWWLAAVTMVVGNVIALASKDIKRLLAYSSIAHAGYILVLLTSGQALGSSAFLFYIVAYTLATFGAFGVVVALGQAGEPYLNVDDYAGLWTVRPWLSVAMAVCMLSLLGFPIFGGAGFFAKWYVIEAALYAPEPQVRLAVLLVLTSVISSGYYMYVVLVMFMKPRSETNKVSDPRSVGSATRWVIGLSTVLLLVLGVFPNALVSLSQNKGSYLLSPTPQQVSQVVPR